MPQEQNTQVPSNHHTSWSTKKTMIIILVVALLIALWFVFRFQIKTPSPEEVLAELTIGDTSNITQPAPPDPQRDTAVSYVVARNAESAKNLGISTVKSKQEIIDYYATWFNQNGWSIESSTQMNHDVYLMIARKANLGQIQVNILTRGEESDSVAEQGPIQVLINYGFGR